MVDEFSLISHLNQINHKVPLTAADNRPLTAAGTRILTSLTDTESLAEEGMGGAEEISKENSRMFPNE